MGIQGSFGEIERKMGVCTKDSVISTVASLFCLTLPWTLARGKVSNQGFLMDDSQKKRAWDPHWERLRVTRRPQYSVIIDNLVWGRLRINSTIFQPVVGEDIKIGKEEWRNNNLLKMTRCFGQGSLGVLGTLLPHHWGGSCLLPSSNHCFPDPANVPYPLSSEFCHGRS